MSRHCSSPASYASARRKRKRVEWRSPDPRLPQGPRKNSSSSPTSAKPAFACPFALAAPDCFPPKSACISSGWPEISRLKEHLYRCHSRQGFSCDRCLESFRSEAHLTAHIRQLEPCPRQELPTQEDPVTHGIGKHAMGALVTHGIGNHAINELKSRRRSLGQDDEEKWYGIWAVIFPGLPRPPSPYTKAPDLFRRSEIEIDLLSKFGRFLKHHLADTILSTMDGAGAAGSADSGVILSRCVDEAIQLYINSANMAMPSPSLSEASRQWAQPPLALSGAETVDRSCSGPVAARPSSRATDQLDLSESPASVYDFDLSSSTGSLDTSSSGLQDLHMSWFFNPSATLHSQTSPRTWSQLVPPPAANEEGPGTSSLLDGARSDDLFDWTFCDPPFDCKLKTSSSA